MRFWRRNGPAEPMPEVETTLVRELEEEAALRRPTSELEETFEPPQAEPAAAEEPIAPAEAAEGADQRGWFGRLRAGLARSSARLNEGINAIFNRRRLDDEALLELEELLISSDMGVGVAGEVTEALRRNRFDQPDDLFGERRADFFGRDLLVEAVTAQRLGNLARDPDPHVA